MHLDCVLLCDGVVFHICVLVVVLLCLSQGFLSSSLLPYCEYVSIFEPFIELNLLLKFGIDSIVEFSVID